MTRKLTAEQLYKLIGFHRSARAAAHRGKNPIRVFRSNEEYAKWRRQLREEESAERKRRREENSDSDQQDESGAKQ